ncbi:hypothetical protein Bealeia1_00518 [Candidatus Bealeia paramacronuclearis]|uniref:Lipoprotein n=1 Tax=Candidatus Bealeia paramacronuclearis TaxID=1921001 RepID=A0ABZ2C1K3_9PROT|nr:hypothetical protein [Candidatus Bealeia paramacronuclearis]
MKKLLSLCLLSVLSGCTTETASEIKCPKIVIASDLNKAVMFDPEGGAPLLRTEMDSVRPKCDIMKKAIEIDMVLRMTSFRKAGSTKPLHGNVSYFVAVVDGQDRILKASDHQVRIDLDEKKSNKISLERIEEKIPLSGYENLKVILGFHLSDDQVLFNRNARNKKVGN